MRAGEIVDEFWSLSDDDYKSIQLVVPNDPRSLISYMQLERGSYHELSRRSGLSRSTVSGVLQGKRGASLDTLRKLSEASGVELGKLTEYVEGQQRQRKGRA